MNFKKVTLQEFNLAPGGQAWLLELEINNEVVASRLLQQEEQPLLKHQREFRNSHPYGERGVVNYYPVLISDR